MVGSNEKKKPFTGMGSLNDEKKRIIRDTFLHELNISGKYYALKEGLRGPIIKLIREKFNKYNALNYQRGYQEVIISELCAYLLEQLKLSIDAFMKSDSNIIHEDISSMVNTEKGNSKLIKDKRKAETTL